MAVAIEEIKILYRELNQSIKDALDGQEAANKLTSQDYAAVLTKLLGMNLEMAVKTVQGQPMIDAQVKAELAKLDTIKQDTALKEQEILVEKQKVTSMIKEDDLKQAQSDIDVAFKQEQINKLKKDEALLDKEINNKQYEYDNILPKQATKLDNENTMLVTQEDEYKKLNTATINVKNEDVTVKQKQEALFTKQAESLDNALIKDVLKEASGGYAMVYDTLSDPTIPGTWAQFDNITNELLSKAGSSITINPQVNNKQTTN